MLGFRVIGSVVVWLSGSACAGSATAPAESAAQTVYVGGYGGEIAVLSFDPSTGALEERTRVKSGGAPSYLAFTRDGKYAYAVDEAGSQVIAYAIDAKLGLRELNRAASGGKGPAHLAVHPSGRWLAVTNYDSGEAVIAAIARDGRIGAVGAGQRGPTGDCKNAHQAVFDRKGERLFVPCLGSDYVLSFRFHDGALTSAEPPLVPVAGGPRHLAFDPLERRVYVLSEHSSVITAFDYAATTASWSRRSAVPSQRQRAGKSAHIAVHPSGRWLFASNRGENSLAVFALEPGQPPRAVGFVTEGLATPRDFSLDPSGRWLLVANQAGAEDVVVFELDPATGALERRGAAAVGGKPAFVQVVAPP